MTISGTEINPNQTKTIRDFGIQWKKHPDNNGFYASVQLLDDLFYPFLKSNELKNKTVADIGSGTGRIVNMLINAGAKHVISVEPSSSFEALKENIVNPEIVTCLNTTGDKLPANAKLDFAFSIGVLHHIPDPKPVLKAIYEALRPKGKFLCWIYGQEGNKSYIFFTNLLRTFSTKLPHWCLSLACWILYIPLIMYMYLCYIFPLPLKRYLHEYFKKLSSYQRRLTIYDQLNPTYAKYYCQKEAEDLLKNAGFESVQCHHRHGYSWTVIGTKPDNHND